MNTDEIKKSVKEYILEQFLPGEDPSTLTEETQLVTDGILDSMASLKLVSYLEEQFGVSVEAHEVDAEHLDTLDLIANMVVEKKKAS